MMHLQNRTGEFCLPVFFAQETKNSFARRPTKLKFRKKTKPETEPPVMGRPYWILKASSESAISAGQNNE